MTTLLSIPCIIHLNYVSGLGHALMQSFLSHLGYFINFFCQCHETFRQTCLLRRQQWYNVTVLSLFTI